MGTSTYAAAMGSGLCHADTVMKAAWQEMLRYDGPLIQLVDRLGPPGDVRRHLSGVHRRVRARPTDGAGPSVGKGFLAQALSQAVIRAEYAVASPTQTASSRQ